MSTARRIKQSVSLNYFSDGNQEESRNPASWEEKLTEKELESIFGGLQE